MAPLLDLLRIAWSALQTGVQWDHYVEREDPHEYRIDVAFHDSGALLASQGFDMSLHNGMESMTLCRALAGRERAHQRGVPMRTMIID